MARTMFARDPIIDARRIYTKGQLSLQEVFMINSTLYPWARTRGSGSTPTSSTQNLSFTSRFREDCSITSSSDGRSVEYNPHKNWVHTD